MLASPFTKASALGLKVDEVRFYDALANNESEELPGQLEMMDGKLCRDDGQRLLLQGALLEHVGTTRAVQLGPLSAWKEAVAQRQEDEGWDAMPAVGVEQFWKPAYQRISFRKRLELKPLVRQWHRRRR